MNLTHVFFPQTVDFSFEVFVLKLRVVVTADVGVVEGVVVQTRQRGFMRRVWAQRLSWIAGPVSSLGHGWRTLPGLQVLLLGPTHRESPNLSFGVGGDLEAADGGGGLWGGAGGGSRRRVLGPSHSPLGESIHYVPTLASSHSQKRRRVPVQCVFRAGETGGG